MTPEKIIELNELFKRFAKFLKILPKYLVDLAEIGWFLSYNHSPADTAEICRKLDSMDHDWIDDYMVNYIDRELDYIKDLMYKHFPEREVLVEKALDAHYNSDYILSIPVLLAQIDGISMQEFKGYFFSAKDKIKINKTISELPSSEIFDAFIKPTLVETSIGSSKKDQNIDGSIFNRHEILHGINLSYGTRINGYKTISLLDYIVSITKK